MYIIGIDEVGRGCWAGPLVAGAAIIPADKELPTLLRDSKKLSAKQREVVNQWIIDNVMVGLGWVSPSEVDHLGLTQAVSMAMRRALQDLQQKYTNLVINQIIIDGHFNFLADIPRSKAVIKADDSVPAVSAASIAAKVARDTFMTTMDERYPAYGFDTHVGYGTATHREALRKEGVTTIHRLSYKPIQNLLHIASSTTRGRLAEAKAAEKLTEQGHTIIAMNWRTKWCEVDIISTKDTTIFFTEVKYRQSTNSGDGLDYITPVKLRQMQRAARSWIQQNDWCGNMSIAAIAVSGPIYQITAFIPSIE